MSPAARRVVIACWLAMTVSVLTGCGASNQHGEELFSLHCVDCHEMPNPDLKKRPPKLDRLFHAKTLPSGAPATDEQVRKTVLQGLRTMPAFEGRLSVDDVKDLISYLHTLD